MSVVHSLRHRARPLLLGAVVALTLNSCQARPVDGQSKTVGGLRHEYDVIDSATVAGHPQSPPRVRMHDGPPPGTDHVTLAVCDAATNQRIDDAEVSLSIRRPRNPAPGTGRLEPIPLDGSATYGGYVRFSIPGATG